MLVKIYGIISEASDKINYRNLNKNVNVKYFKGENSHMEIEVTECLVNDSRGFEAYKVPHKKENDVVVFRMTNPENNKSMVSISSEFAMNGIYRNFIKRLEK
jgi:hypothetical protein